MEALFMSKFFTEKLIRVFKRTNNSLKDILLLSLIPVLVYFVAFVFPRISNIEYIFYQINLIKASWFLYVCLIAYISLIAIAYLFLYYKNFVEDKTLFIKPDEDVDFVPYKEDSPLNWTVFNKNIYATDDKNKFNNLFDQFLQILIEEKNIGAKVVSLEASWGAGKTSFFRIFKGWFQSEENINKTANLKFYEYNPWLSQSNYITQDFLHYLKSIIYTEKNIFIETEINNYIQSISASSIKDSSLSFYSNLLPATPVSFQVSKHTLQEEINNALSKTKIVILIDNIDRLNSHEIIKVLELVKDVADFKNLIFVLAMDKNIVNLAINKEIAGVNSKHYLEKIIDTEYTLKWAENEYNFLKDFIFKLYFEALEKSLHYVIRIKNSEDNIKTLFEILIVEVFRTKYLKMLENSEGVNYVEGKQYVKLEKNKGWDRFSDFIHKIYNPELYTAKEIIFRFGIYSKDYENKEIYTHRTNDLRVNNQKLRDKNR